MWKHFLINIPLCSPRKLLYLREFVPLEHLLDLANGLGLLRSLAI